LNANSHAATYSQDQLISIFTEHDGAAHGDDSCAGGNNRGDLVINLISPGFSGFASLSNREDGFADNFIVTGLDVSSSFAFPLSPSGQWELFVEDLARKNVGTINSFVLHITSSR